LHKPKVMWANIAMCWSAGFARLWSIVFFNFVTSLRQYIAVEGDPLKSPMKTREAVTSRRTRHDSLVTDI